MWLHLPALIAARHTEEMNPGISEDILNLIDKLLQPTLEQLAMLDEHGDWMETPEDQESSTTEPKTT
jgi:hypothetical protein